MNDIHIIWDLPDEPDGNYVHIIDGHDVTVDEVEEILRDPDSEDVVSRSSGPLALFFTMIVVTTMIVVAPMNG